MWQGAAIFFRRILILFFHKVFPIYVSCVSLACLSWVTGSLLEKNTRGGRCALWSVELYCNLYGEGARELAACVYRVRLFFDPVFDGDDAI